MIAMGTISRDYPTKLFTRKEAVDMAVDMNADVDDDWSYHAIHDPKGTGGSFIEIHDEDGEFVGKL